MEILQSLEGKVMEYCLLLDSKITSVLKINLHLADQCAFVDSIKEEIFYGLIAFIGLLIIGGIYSIYKLNKTSNNFQAKLINIRTITHDTKIFTFDLPSGMNKIGLNVGEHLELEAVINGETVARKYTPISRADLKRNSFDLLIKIYHKTQTMSGGKMTMYLDTLKIGDSIKVTLPYGRFNYKGNSVVQIKQLDGKIKTQAFDNIYMVGGGTGITPLYQIIQYITEAETQTKKPEITLLFANRTEDDILMKSQIEDLERQNKHFRCFFSIDKSIKEGWTGLLGFIDEEKLKKTLPEDLNNTLFAVCGPPILCNIIEKLLTTKFNVNPNQFFRF